MEQSKIDLLSVQDLIKAALEKISITGDLILSSVGSLEGDSEKQAQIVLKDLAEKNLLLEDILQLCSHLSAQEIDDLSRDLILEINTTCSHFE